MDFQHGVSEAHGRIEPHVRRTPVELSPFLHEGGAGSVHLKLENLQRTGSFKFRGAMNKLLGLTEEQRLRGVVAASTGNHGLAVTCGAALLGCQAVIFAPHAANASKLEAIAAHGGEVRLEGDDCVVAEVAARAYARSSGRTYVSPYNDPLVVAGQGTIGLELDLQLEHIDAVFVAVGGGGLISGIGGYLKAIGREVEVIACSPENSPVMHASLEAGRILDLECRPTLSEGTAGGIEEGAITFGLCREIVDESVLVSEPEIAEAVRLVLARHHTLIEGAAGVAVAALRRQGDRFRDRHVVVVLCGANIDPADLKELL